jgi:2-keto-4-pentenoate hydratase/2-oxohepta-3-ene-1,7-dioic acid hydratase in catechol pathway
MPVGKVVCVGRNYAAHAAELGNPVPEQPLLFIKPPSAVVDLAPQFRVPTAAGSVHHELEIALLIGRELCAATPDRARRAIAGIGLGIDLTLRELQDRLKAKAHPWEVSKGFDGACALSPFVPLDPALDLAALPLRLVVNGRRRQFGSSAQMLTPIIELLCFASARFTLWPGDVVLTGTPAGVGPLVPGDRLLAELGGVLQLRAIVTA